MNRGLFKSLLMAVVLAGAVLAASQAEAGWNHWRGYCGVPYVGWTGYSYSYYGGWGAGCCEPAYVSYCAPSYSCYDPCYSYCGYRGCGLLGRLGYRWRAHHYGYYWGCGDPCYTSSCCSVCGYADCGCGAGTIIDYGTPMQSSPTPAEPPAEGSSVIPEQQTSIMGDSAFLTVSVPNNAHVFVNGIQTRSTGEQRRYVSRNLVPGFDYTYEIRTEMVVDGKPVAQTRTVQLRAGQQAQLAFQTQAPETLETALTLHVPANAQVFLAGNPTNGDGPIRTFRTTKLAKGESWSDYVVRVVVNENGLSRSLEETVSLQAGEQRALSFDFDVDKVASVR